jgi:superfamily II DNA or RNA helicase
MQFVQRRGRILRPHKNKEFAVVHDFIVSPPQRLADGDGPVFSAERSLVRKELERVMMFAESARNHPDADVDGIPTSEASLQDLKRRFNLLDL